MCLREHKITRPGDKGRKRNNMKRVELIENLKKICDEANSHDSGYHYEMKANDWEKGNKSRTYFSIIETREGTRHYNKKDYGYFDNISNEYVEGYSNNLDSTLFTFSGAKF